MNFYKRFIGDIQAKTGGLTLAEFGAYDRLLDHYYSTEKPIAVKEAHRICRAMTSGERAAVDAVLERFWTLTEEGYTQSKADEVIAKAQPLIEAARANGKKGGRPKKETQPEPAGFSGETQPEPSAKAIQSQSQIPSNEGKKDSAIALLLAKEIPEDLARDFLAIRKAKKAPLTPTALKGIEREAGKAGFTLHKTLELCCTRGWQSFEAVWVQEQGRGAPTQGRHTDSADDTRRMLDQQNQGTRTMPAELRGVVAQLTGRKVA